jgi:hypothetical protein
LCLELGAVAASATPTRRLQDRSVHVSTEKLNGGYRKFAVTRTLLQAPTSGYVPGVSCDPAAG